MRTMTHRALRKIKRANDFEGLLVTAVHSSTKVTKCEEIDLKWMCSRHKEKMTRLSE
jgi:hypothetical protein